MTYREPEYLYLAQARSGLFKIGISKDVLNRLGYVTTGAPPKLIKRWHRPGDARLIERAVKALLSGYSEYHEHAVFEWFRVTKRQAMAAIDCAIVLSESPDIPFGFFKKLGQITDRKMRNRAVKRRAAERRLANV